jgi:hypothetical protein
VHYSEIVARNCAGNFLGAKCIHQQISVDLKLPEAMAALNAVLFSKEVGRFLNVMFEGDALQVVFEINSDPPFLNRVGHFIESIHLELGLLRSSCFAFIPREANSIAHTLAKDRGCYF